MSKKDSKTTPFEEAKAIIPNIEPIDWDSDFTDKILVINPRLFKPEYRTKEGLIWQIKGGFGCSPFCIGKTTSAICLSDGEQVNWHRDEWVAEVVPEVVPEDNKVTITLDIDFSLLRQQKERIVNFACQETNGSIKADLDGIIHLIDAIQDEAAKQLGEKVIFG